MNENECVLQKGRLCLGPVTYGGCNSVCRNNDIPCYGCRGPLDDANLDAITGIFEDAGLTPDDIKRAFIKFAGTSKKLREEVNIWL